MILLKQPNRWSCLLASFAMALDVSIEQLIKEIGHDGSELMWNHLPEPQKRKSFHIQEFMASCLHRHKAFVPMECHPIAMPDPAPKLKDIEDRLIRIVETQSAKIEEMRVLLALIQGIKENRYTVKYPSIFALNEELIKCRMKDKTGVITGQSLSGNAHAVAWDGKMIYDPTGPIIRELDEFIIDTFWWIIKFDS